MPAEKAKGEGKKKKRTRGKGKKKRQINPEIFMRLRKQPSVRKPRQCDCTSDSTSPCGFCVARREHADRMQAYRVKKIRRFETLGTRKVRLDIRETYLHQLAYGDHIRDAYLKFEYPIPY